MKNVNIIPKGKKGETQGMPSSYDLRETPKNWGKRKVVGVIRSGKYINPDTGDPIELVDKKVPIAVRISVMGGVE